MENEIKVNLGSIEGVFNELMRKIDQGESITINVNVDLNKEDVEYIGDKLTECTEKLVDSIQTINASLGDIYRQMPC